MKRSAPPPLSTLERCTEPYIRYVSKRIGGASSALWMEGADLFSIFEEEWVDAKWSACFGLRDLFDSNSTPSFSSQDLKISRFILEGLHLAVDLSIIVPRMGIEMYNLFERIVPMVTLIRANQHGIDPTLSLKDIAQAINQHAASRKLAQCSGKDFLSKIEQAFVVADNPFEAGLLDAIFAIEQGLLEPMDLICYIGAGGDASC